MPAMNNDTYASPDSPKLSIDENFTPIPLNKLTNGKSTATLEDLATVASVQQKQLGFAKTEIISNNNYLSEPNKPNSLAEQAHSSFSPINSIPVPVTVNPFVNTIKRMLSPESQLKYRTADQLPVFGWSDCGRYLFIRNPQTLFSMMMAEFFVTTNLNSFIRQLNHYNFTKVKLKENSLTVRRQPDQTLIYEHPTFNRDTYRTCDLERKAKGFTRVPKTIVSAPSPVETSDYVARDEFNMVYRNMDMLWQKVNELVQNDIARRKELDNVTVERNDLLKRVKILENGLKRKLSIDENTPPLKISRLLRSNSSVE
jgi:hypothetical protein